YDGYVKSYVDDMQSEYILPLWRAMNDASTEIFQAGVFRKYFKSGNWKQRQVKLPGKPYFLSAEKYKLQRFINQLEQYAVAIEWGNINIENALDRAVTLDSLIKIEYHLK
ncbi:MAG TPA: hypothetical protein VFT15_14645, partial [Chitinophagaceae bacterium]|nr:hypothetical protein [Chitinophagaceae bacterium]